MRLVRGDVDFRSVLLARYLDPICLTACVLVFKAGSPHFFKAINSQFSAYVPASIFKAAFAFATAGGEVVIGVNFVPASRPAAGSRLYLTFRYTIAITYQHLRLLSNTV